MSDVELANTKPDEADSAYPNGSRFHEKTRALGSRDMRKFLIYGPPIGLLSHSAATYFPDLEFRPVQSIDELKKASHLIYHEYLRSEFIAANKREQKFNLFQTLPSTVTFVAIYKKERVLGTLTTIEDSPLGVPMDNLYYDELMKLRLAGRRMAEFTMLAMDKDIMESGEFFLKPTVRWLLLFHLIRAVCDYLRACTNVDLQVACFHPKHDSFYKMLNKVSFGGLRYYAGVKGKPALARYADFPQALKQGTSHTYNRLFLREIPPSLAFANRLQFSSQDLKELFVEHSNILASADHRKLNYIQSQHPTHNMLALIESKSLFTHLLESLETHRSNLAAKLQ